MLKALLREKRPITTQLIKDAFNFKIKIWREVFVGGSLPPCCKYGGRARKIARYKTSCCLFYSYTILESFLAICFSVSYTENDN